MRSRFSISSSFATSWANSADNKLMIFFFKKSRIGISCKLSQLETICMKYQILFYGKSKKNIFVCR